MIRKLCLLGLLLVLLVVSAGCIKNIATED